MKNNSGKKINEKKIIFTLCGQGIILRSFPVTLTVTSPHDAIKENGAWLWAPFFMVSVGADSRKLGKVHNG